MAYLVRIIASVKTSRHTLSRYREIMKFRRILFYILSLTFAILTVTPAAAQSVPPHTPEQRHLVIATADNGPISINRLLYTALRNIRHNVDFITPIVREGYIQADEGICDGVIAGYPDLHLTYTNLIQVPVPLEHINVRVFAREGSELNINSWDELGGLHVGILENRPYIPQRLPANVTISTRSTNRAVLNGLIDGEYDAAVLVERDHETLGERLNIIRVGVVDQLIEHLYLNKKHEALVPQLTDSLENMFREGSAARILNDLPTPAANQKRTIVHIISSSIEIGRVEQFNAELRNHFEDEMSVEWMTVNLDTRRFTRGQQNMAYIASLLRADCVPRNIAAVIVSGEPALEFLKDYYYLYFRNVPVLFSGVSERYREIIDDNEHNFTGIVKNLEAYRTVEAALSIFPGTQNIFVVNDYTAEGIQYRTSIESELSLFEGRLNIEYNDNLDITSLLERVNTLPENSLVLYGSYFVDSDHQYFTHDEMKRLLERNCAVPIFTVYSTRLPYNAIGGMVPDYQKYGMEIARMLERLLSGSRAENIPVIQDSTAFNRWVFDQNQLDAFGINPNTLPAGADVINRPPTIWESNPQFVIAMLILSVISLLIIIGVIIFLFVSHKHNKQKDELRQALTVEKSMLEAIFDSVPEILFIKDLDHKFIRINKQFEKHFGCDRDMIIGKKGYENELLGVIVDDYMKTEITIVNENRLIMIEKQIRGADGSEPFFEIIAGPLLSNGKVLGIAGIAYNIAHRKKMEDDVQAASRAKSNFLANMSHEMRTPLTAVLGLTEFILETVQLDDETHANLVKVYRSGETILNLVNDVLDISKIEADRLELYPLEYDVPSLLNDTITQSALYAEDKPVKLILNIHEDLPNYLYGDELRIRQILNNLLSNAFKFTKEGTVELGVECECDGDTVWFTGWVRDTGIGIRPEDMNKLFTLYGKMEEEINRGGVSRRIEGTGLGLAISKRIARMMDGAITAESEYGKGSVFTVKLRQKYVSDAVIGPDIAERLKKFDYSLTKFENVKMTRINLSYARVLVVDDNPTNLDVTKGLMGLYGMKIDCATGGQQAVDIIRSEKIKYDAVFMDHMMPEVDGIQATHMIREEIGTEYARTIPIIALTANAIAGNESLFLNKGFQAFISKPIDLARLDAVLRQWVRDKETETLLHDKIINIEAMRRKGLRIPEIPGLDTDKGIAHFGFSEDLYWTVLQSYAKNTRPLLDLLANVDEDNLNIYAVTIHGIKGSSRGIFAEKIGDEAEALEKAAADGVFDFVKNNNQKFIDGLQRLLADIESALTKNEKERKPAKDMPDSSLLAELVKACEHFDIDEIDAVMDAIEAYDYTSDGGLAGWLRETLDKGKYNSVKERLTALTQNTEV